MAAQGSSPYCTYKTMPAPTSHAETTPHLNCAYSTAPVEGSTATRPTSTACAAAPPLAGSSTHATRKLLLPGEPPGWRELAVRRMRAAPPAAAAAAAAPSSPSLGLSSSSPPSSPACGRVEVSRGLGCHTWTSVHTPYWRGQSCSITHQHALPNPELAVSGAASLPHPTSRCTAETTLPPNPAHLESGPRVQSRHAPLKHPGLVVPSLLDGGRLHLAHHAHLQRSRARSGARDGCAG